MTRLGKDDIVGQRLARIVQQYQLLDGYLNWTDNRVVLESGIAFRFPTEHGESFFNYDFANDFDDIEHPDLETVIGATITQVYRPRKGQEICDFSDEVYLKLDTGYWVSQLHCAPQGIDCGVVISSEGPEEFGSIIAFWADDN